MENIKVGLITKTQGLKGDFRVKAENKYLKYIESLNTVTIMGMEYHIKKIVNRGGFFVFTLTEFNDINQIEKFINQPIFANIDVIETVVEDYTDYVVIANEKEVGVVEEVNNYGASDVITLTNGKMFAVSPNLILEVNKLKKQLVVDGNILNEVIIWE